MAAQPQVGDLENKSHTPAIFTLIYQRNYLPAIDNAFKKREI